MYKKLNSKIEVGNHNNYFTVQLLKKNGLLAGKYNTPKYCTGTIVHALKTDLKRKHHSGQCEHNTPKYRTVRPLAPLRCHTQLSTFSHANSPDTKEFSLSYSSYPNSHHFGKRMRRIGSQYSNWNFIKFVMYRNDYVIMKSFI